MTVELIFGLIGVVLGLSFFFTMLLLFGRAVRRAQGQIDLLRHETERMAAQVKVLEQQRLQLVADNEARRQRAGMVAKDIAILRDQTVGVIKKAQQVYYILSDRWTTADEEWIVPIRNLTMFGRSFHRDVIESWSEGRSYVVWAPRSEIAMRQVETKFPASGGYLVGAPVPSPLKFATKWAIKTAPAGDKGAEAARDADG